MYLPPSPKKKIKTIDFTQYHDAIDWNLSDSTISVLPKILTNWSHYTLLIQHGRTAGEPLLTSHCSYSCTKICINGGTFHSIWQKSQYNFERMDPTQAKCSTSFQLMLFRGFVITPQRCLLSYGCLRRYKQKYVYFLKKLRIHRFVIEILLIGIMV